MFVCMKLRVRRDIILHRFQLCRKVRLAHEAPSVPVMNISMSTGARRQTEKENVLIKHSFLSSVGRLVYLQLDQALQPHQGRLGNPVAPTGAKCCK